ncbi:RNA polymerase II transcription elongation factor SpEAF [Malassezia nana]|uniref:Vacuolar import and degradation protein 21 n=1 Tax=Malassezia nana TaxID=180528 RepID=A0AAF0J1Y5_9BASI|nr:RNA polymerase II transcription elongation factor SpEAF [Malassezia nana]
MALDPSTAGSRSREASSSRLTLDDLRSARLSQCRDEQKTLSQAHRAELRHLLFLLRASEGDPARAAHVPEGQLTVVDAEAEAFLEAHALPDGTAKLAARVAAVAEALRAQAATHLRPDREGGLEAPSTDTRAVRARASRSTTRLPPSPMPWPAMEYEQTLPSPVAPVALQALAPNPLSVTYASSLRPLPSDPTRRLTGIGMGGGSMHHRPRRAPKGAVTGKPGAKTAAAPADLTRWSVRVRAASAASLVRKANKCLLTRDWKVAFTEQKFIKAMARIDELKQAGHWSFRQPKRSRGPVERKTHWDFLLEEMRWLQTDFREERKWKLAMAYELVHQVAQWHRSTPEERARLCVQRGSRRAWAMELDEAAPEALASPPMETDEPAANVEEEAPSPKAEAEVDADMDTHADKDDDADEPVTNTKPAPDEMDAEGEDEEPREPTLTMNEAEAPAESAPLRKGADQQVTLADKLPLALMTAIRAPIFGLDTTATSVSPWALLQNLDPQMSSALTQLDGTLDAKDLDFGRLFPELPQYAPPNATSDEGAAPKRRDEGAGASSSRLVHVSRLLDAKPALVSTLDPANHRANGQWHSVSDHTLGAMDWVGSEATSGTTSSSNTSPWSVQAGSLLFARKAGKPPREYTSPLGAPVAPAHPEVRIAQLSWTSDDDAFVQALAKHYQEHWALVADIFNSARWIRASERRTAWDCYERCKWLANEQREQRPEGKTGRKQYRQHLLEIMRKTAKRREQAQRQAAAAAAANANTKRAALGAHDTHVQPKAMATPTPQALSLLKAERDQAALRQFFEQQRASQLAFAQQAQQQLSQTQPVPQSQSQSQQQQQQQRRSIVQATTDDQQRKTALAASPSPAKSPANTTPRAAPVSLPRPSPSAQGSPSPLPTQQYLAALAANQGLGGAKHAPNVAMAGVGMSNALPFVRAGQPFFPLDVAGGSAAKSSNLAAAGGSPSAPAGAAPTPGPGASAMAPRPPQPIVIAASPQTQALRMGRAPGAMDARPLGFSEGGANTNSPSLAFSSPPVGLQGMPSGTGAPPVRPGAPAMGAPLGHGAPPAVGASAPPNLHALQQQLAMTLAASHLSQEQINGLAVQLYKQAQAQQQQRQAQAQAQAQGAPPANAGPAVPAHPLGNPALAAGAPGQGAGSPDPGAAARFAAQGRGLSSGASNT